MGTDLAGYGEYEIDIEDTLRQGLPGAFAQIGPAPLTADHVAAIPRGTKGAYLLFFDGRMVYAGKTDTRHGFRDRLGRHADSVRHRVGLDPNKITFKAMRIMVFSAFDVEAILISEMRRIDRGALRWNDSGFGSNDPGRNRDLGKPADFDREYPIDIDVELAGLPEGPVIVTNLLKAAKEAVPYLLRYDVGADAGQAQVILPDGPRTMRACLDAIASGLPDSFQITVFDGRIILYPLLRHYEFAREVISGRA